jgi:hypothetical protein
MLKRNLLLLSVHDFFTKEIMKIAFFPFLLTLIVLYILFFIGADMGFEQLQHSTLHVEQSQTTITDGIPHTEHTSETAQGSGIIDFLLKYSLTSWLISFLLYTVGSLFVLLLSIVISLSIIGFLTPAILKVIQRRHYPDIEMVGHGNIATITWHFLKSLFVMSLLLFIMIPFYFIPVVNIVAINLPFYYFFHRLMVFDVVSTIMTKDEYARIHVANANAIRLKTLILYLVSLIPFAILFANAFYIIYLGHDLFTRLRAIRPPFEADTATIQPPPDIV